MFRPAYIFACICFIMAAVGSWYSADYAVRQFENQTADEVSAALSAAGHDWARVKPNGLQVELTGVAPTETERFRAIEIMAKIVDTDRITDAALIIPPSDLEPPRFSLEILRNEDRISLIGLVPDALGSASILSRLEDISDAMVVTDMLESADHPVPTAWLDALDYGLENLSRLPRSKISISATEVTVSAVTESVDEQQNVRSRLALTKPDGIDLFLDISAPRPVIAPFRFRLVLSEDGAELLSCSADTEDTRQEILRAVARLGVQGKLRCEIGLGVPTTDWAEAIEISLGALADLGGGSIGFSDSDISLISDTGTSQETFEAVIGRLESDLPELFTLNAVLPPKLADSSDGVTLRPAELVAELALDGTVNISGRIDTAISRMSIVSVAEALYGDEAVVLDTLTDPGLPNNWAVRSMAALKALSMLSEGKAVVQTEKIEISGRSDLENVSSEVDRILSSELGSGNYEIAVRYDDSLIPDPDHISDLACEAAIYDILNERQIVFDPGAVTLTEESEETLSVVADVLFQCPQAEFQIQGHTDSQGPDDLNLEISQSRAETILSGLLNRRVLIHKMEAKGYGSSQPIADNETEEGRALNRRIVFALKSKVDAYEAEIEQEDLGGDDAAATTNADENEVVENDGE